MHPRPCWLYLSIVWLSRHPITAECARIIGCALRKCPKLVSRPYVLAVRLLYSRTFGTQAMFFCRTMMRGIGRVRKTRSLPNNCVRHPPRQLSISKVESSGDRVGKVDVSLALNTQTFRCRQDWLD